MNNGMIGNPRGMHPQEAFQHACRLDANQNRVMDELRPASLELARKLDRNNDRMIDVGELAHGLAQGDVFVNLQTRTIGAFDKPALVRLFN